LPALINISLLNVLKVPHIFKMTLVIHIHLLVNLWVGVSIRGNEILISRKGII
jgi:hypothetical protein